MRIPLSKIAQALDADLHGNGDLVIEGLAEPASAGPADLALATNKTYAEALGAGQARAAVLWPGADPDSMGLDGAILPRRPRFAMATLTQLADPGQNYGAGIHATAVIDPTADLGANVQIGPYSVVGPGAKIGADSVIGPFCFIGAEASLGPSGFLREHVSIGARVVIGARFIAQPGARVGADGFSFVTEAKSTAEAARESLGEAVSADGQPWFRIHSLGAVHIGDDVEVGANACIDSGTIRPTRIGDGTKLDNLVHVGHNCDIGQHCLLCGQVGLAGSVRIGNHVVLGGQVGVSDNVVIGDNVVAGGSSKIYTNVPAGRAVLGDPATKMDTQIDIYKAIRRLPRLVRDVAALKKSVFKSDAND